MTTISIPELSIVLIEPSSTQARIITSHLKNMGVKHTSWFKNAKTAIQEIRNAHPDLVISAMHLPDETAVEFIGHLRAHPELEETPFMLISSETSYQYLEPLRQAGVVAILPKPFDPQDLRKALYTTLDYLVPFSEDQVELHYENLRVLVVDDSIPSRKQISRVLNNMGIEQIQEAVNGKQAKELIESNYYDLLVTDYNMPEMDGRELTEHIREKSSQGGIPILMVTSEADQNRLLAVKQSGVSAVCDKPFEPTLMKDIIKKLLD